MLWYMLVNLASWILSNLCLIPALYAKISAFYAKVPALYAEIPAFYDSIYILRFRCADNIRWRLLLGCIRSVANV